MADSADAPARGADIVPAPRAKAPLLLTCEHASCAVPRRYAGLGLEPEQLRDHIGWDIGAAELTTRLAAMLEVPAVLSTASRLLVDCNRETSAPDLMPRYSHGVGIPANEQIDDAERDLRLRGFYAPFHDAVDATVSSSAATLLLSVHSFSPVLGDSERGFDVGVLFDDFDEAALRLADLLRHGGLAVRMNEPYSGLQGLIYSAQRHGRRHGVPYLEIEVNNGLLRRPSDIAAVAHAVEGALRALLAAHQAGIDPVAPRRRAAPTARTPPLPDTGGTREDMGEEP